MSDMQRHTLAEMRLRLKAANTSPCKSPLEVTTGRLHHQRWGAKRIRPRWGLRHDCFAGWLLARPRSAPPLNLRNQAIATYPQSTQSHRSQAVASILGLPSARRHNLLFSTRQRSRHAVPRTSVQQGFRSVQRGRACTSGPCRSGQVRACVRARRAEHARARFT